MHLHLIQDNGFLNNFIRIADQLDPGNNQYVLLRNNRQQNQIKAAKVNAGTVHVMKYPSIEFSNLIQNKNIDKVFIHFLDESACDVVVKNADSNIKFIWIFWGADFYSPYSKFADYLYDDLSLDYYKKHGTQSSLSSPVLDALKRIYQNSIGSYFEELKYTKKVQAIQRIDYLAHYNIRDFHTVSKRIETKAQYLPFFYFEFNYGELRDKQKSATLPPSKPFTFQLGNSASLSNNHLYALQLIAQYKNNDISVFCPLAYGDKRYGDKVEYTGQQLLGSKIKSIRSFIPPHEYYQKLFEIDIAVMNHIRAESAGNVFMLVAMGKPVFMNPKNNLMHFLQDIGVHVFNIQDLESMKFNELNQLLQSKELLEKNSNIIVSYFAESNAAKNIKGLLNI